MTLQYFSSYLHHFNFYLISRLFLQSFQKYLKKAFYLENLFGFPLFTGNNLFGYYDHTSSFCYSVTLRPLVKASVAELSDWLSQPKEMPCVFEMMNFQQNEFLREGQSKETNLWTYTKKINPDLSNKQLSILANKAERVLLAI